ncbi:hypothetical protein CEXT_722741 [Caerostris extrusa]|uniref:Uncharacterized protein n=1 Tax=Caerostris extrusa TaxID=172846 RepID=A0AAV4QXT2_CAEEX|nr:hypothetical protein CEXT_722741 [Caerostris extrusa]
MSQDERLGASSDMNRISRVHWTMPLLMRWIPDPRFSSTHDFEGSRSLLLLLLLSSSFIEECAFIPCKIARWQSRYLGFLKHVERREADFSQMLIFIIEELINRAENLICLKECKCIRLRDMRI